MKIIANIPRAFFTAKFTRAFTCVIIFVSLVMSSSAQAEESFWQSLDSATISHSSDSDNLSANLTTSQQFDLQNGQASQRAISFTQDFSADSTLSFEYADAIADDNKQRNFTLGYTQDNLSLSVMRGAGEDIANLAGEYSGVDPYLFHGGIQQDFNVSGYAVDYGFGRLGHMQYGQATVQSNGFHDRRARYVEWSKNSMFARATRFARGGENIGDGLEFGFAVGNKMLAVQGMKLDNDRSMQRLRLQMNGKRSNQYWLDLSKHQNSLFKANDDVRVMFNFRTVFGAKQLASYQNAGGTAGGTGDQEAAEGETGTTTTKKKGKAWKRGLYIGAGVAAAAALSSSGSSKQDESSRFRTQLDAAFSVLNGINPTSVRENREYGGWVFVNQDGSYASTNPVKGEAASVNLPRRSQVIPVGSRATATYHTHAAFDPRFDNENFSPTDISSDQSAGVDGYLATPGGQLKYHNVATGAITTVGTVATN